MTDIARRSTIGIILAAICVLPLVWNLAAATDEQQQQEQPPQPAELVAAKVPTGTAVVVAIGQDGSVLDVVNVNGSQGATCEELFEEESGCLPLIGPNVESKEDGLLMTTVPDPEGVGEPVTGSAKLCVRIAGRRVCFGL